MKKIIPALALLLVSAILMSTAGYAWFSMNTTVEATGMQVTAKSNSTFLLINTGDNDTYTKIQTAGTTEIALTVQDADSDLYPAKPVTEDSEVTTLDTNNGDTAAPVKVTTAATAAAFANWYTANAATPDAYTAVNGSMKQLTSFTDYVIQKTAYLTLADGSADAENLTVTPTITIKDTYSKTTDVELDASKTYYTFSASTYTEVQDMDRNVNEIADYYEKANLIDAVRVLVVITDADATTNDQYAILKSGDSATNLYKEGTGNNVKLTDTSVVTVNIYIYYDGSVSSVFTNNAAKLSAATIDLTFGVTAINS